MVHLTTARGAKKAFQVGFEPTIFGFGDQRRTTRPQKHVAQKRAFFDCSNFSTLNKPHINNSGHVMNAPPTEKKSTKKKKKKKN